MCLCRLSNLCERLCPRVDGWRTQLRACSQRHWGTRNVVSSRESGLWGRRIWILACFGVKPCFTVAWSIKTTLWFAKAVSFLESWSYFRFLFFFFVLPHLLGGRDTVPALTESASPSVKLFLRASATLAGIPNTLWKRGYCNMWMCVTVQVHWIWSDTY